jgi:DNA replication protein DnaC
MSRIVPQSSAGLFSDSDSEFFTTFDAFYSDSEDSCWKAHKTLLIQNQDSDKNQQSGAAVQDLCSKENKRLDVDAAVNVNNEHDAFCCSTVKSSFDFTGISEEEESDDNQSSFTLHGISPMKNKRARFEKSRDEEEQSHPSNVPSHEIIDLQSTRTTSDDEEEYNALVYDAIDDSSDSSQHHSTTRIPECNKDDHCSTTEDGTFNAADARHSFLSSSLEPRMPNKEAADDLQTQAIQIAQDGKNLFLTGKAGTGKSWTTRKIVERLERRLHVTAPTGIAAINVKGTTIHKWGGFGLGEYYSDFHKMWDLREQIRKTDCLLIDEVSMLDGHLMDILEVMVLSIRCYDEIKDQIDMKHIPAMLEKRWKPKDKGGLREFSPWGGMQLIVIGDFFQLPPVARTDEGNLVFELDSGEEKEKKVGRQGSYAFESRVWQNSNFHVIELEKVHRQSDNDGLFELLNAMREGKPNLSSRFSSQLSSLVSPLRQRSDDIKPTELHSKNFTVKSRNQVELHNLMGQLQPFKSLETVELSESYHAKLREKYEDDAFTRISKTEEALETLKVHANQFFFYKHCRVPINIDLKEKAQVMLLWNLDVEMKLANGSRGVVKGFIPSVCYHFMLLKHYKKKEQNQDMKKIERFFNILTSLQLT